MELVNFDDYVKLIEKLKIEKGEECMYCHLPISNKNDQITLKCKHHYHKNCLKTMSGNKSKFYICCYCEKVTYKTELNIPRCKFILQRGKNKGKECNRINCSYHKNKINIINDNNIKDDHTLCTAILKTGKNKGNVCNRKNCKIHKKITNPNSDITL
jgi:hypothetical protein